MPFFKHHGTTLSQEMVHMALSENESKALCQHKRWSVRSNHSFAGHTTAPSSFVLQTHMGAMCHHLAVKCPCIQMGQFLSHNNTSTANFGVCSKLKIFILSCRTSAKKSHMWIRAANIIKITGALGVCSALHVTTLHWTFVKMKRSCTEGERNTQFISSTP